MPLLREEAVARLLYRHPFEEDMDDVPPLLLGGHSEADSVVGGGFLSALMQSKMGEET